MEKLLHELVPRITAVLAEPDAAEPEAAEPEAAEPEMRIPGHRERRFQPKVNIHSKAS